MSIGHSVAVALMVVAGLAGPAGAQPLAEVTLPTRNYVNNGGFERGTEGWEYFGGNRFGEVVTDVKHSGNASFRVSGLIDDYRYLNQAPMLLTPGRTYTLSAWMKAEGFRRAGTEAQVLNLTNYGWTKSAQLNPAEADQGWTRYTVTFEAFPTAEANGRPSYTLVVFWPIRSEGTVWIDDVQIEEAPTASDFVDSYVGWGMETLETLRRTQVRAESNRASLAGGLGGMQVPATVLQRADKALEAVAELAGRLNSFAGLSVAEAKALPEQAKALEAEVLSLSTLAFVSDSYLPLSEVVLPEEEPKRLVAGGARCLHGGTWSVALNVANLGPQSTVVRLVPGVLSDGVLGGVPLPGVSWAKCYSVPPLRGHLKSWERFTDPLVPLDQAGTWTLGGGQISQCVITFDTTGLEPGSYGGEIEIQFLTEPAATRKLGVWMTVRPVRLAELKGPAICDIGAMADYALDSIQPLGLNTFTVPAQWLVPSFDREGKGELEVDFCRIRPLVEARLQRCPEARFWLGFHVGGIITNHLKQVYGIEATDPRYAKYLTSWLKSVVREFEKLGVGPERLILETLDEPGEGQMEEAAMIARTIKTAEPRVLTQTYVTSFNANSPTAMEMYKAHDIIAPAFTSINDETVSALRKLGKQIWVYDCQNSAETFHPLTYYRLLPWLAWRYKLDGWGHFSMLNSERGRNYEPWEGVAEESLVYPDAAGGQIISRRWLALEAGVQDYRMLQTLQGLLAAAKRSGKQPDEHMEKLLAETPDKALALARPGREYFTGLREGADPQILQRFRDDVVGAAMHLAPPPRVGNLRVLDGGKGVSLDLPAAGEVTLRYLCDHKLPWRTLTRTLPAGPLSLEVPASEGRVTRALAWAAGPDGLVRTWTTPRFIVQVDDTMRPYRLEHLCDGLAMPGMKFEPEHGWISSGKATEHWVEVDLAERRPLKGVTVWWMSFYGTPEAVKLQVWQDGTWHDAPGWTDWRPATASVEELLFATEMTAGRVRVVQKAGGGNRTFPNLMGMSEIEPIVAE